MLTVVFTWETFRSENTYYCVCKLCKRNDKCVGVLLAAACGYNLHNFNIHSYYSSWHTYMHAYVRRPKTQTDREIHALPCLTFAVIAWWRHVATSSLIIKIVSPYHWYILHVCVCVGMCMLFVCMSCLYIHVHIFNRATVCWFVIYCWYCWFFYTSFLFLFFLFVRLYQYCWFLLWLLMLLLLTNNSFLSLFLVLLYVLVYLFFVSIFGFFFYLFVLSLCGGRHIYWIFVVVVILQIIDNLIYLSGKCNKQQQ